MHIKSQQWNDNLSIAHGLTARCHRYVISFFFRLHEIKMVSVSRNRWTSAIVMPEIKWFRRKSGNTEMTDPRSGVSRIATANKCVAVRLKNSVSLPKEFCTNGICVFSRWTYRNNAAPSARSARSTSCTRWRSTRSPRSARELRAGVVTTGNSRVSEVRPSPSSGRR